MDASNRKKDIDRRRHFGINTIDKIKKESIIVIIHIKSVAR